MAIQAFRPGSLRAGVALLLALLLLSPASLGEERHDQGERYAEAERLAMEISGALVPSVQLTARIAGDLKAIRTRYPYFVRITAVPKWQPETLFVQLSPAALQDFRDKAFVKFEQLNRVFGLVEVSDHGDGWVLLRFSRAYHPQALAKVYETLDGVRKTEANRAIGDSDDITSTEAGLYTFRRGWGDCPAGCIFNHVWVFAVRDGAVELVEDSGNELPSGEHPFGKP